jgi:hypothetical protein
MRKFLAPVLAVMCSTAFAKYDDIKFTGRFESKELIYQPIFHGLFNEDGSYTYFMAVSYVTEDFPAGNLTNPTEEAKIQKEVDKQQRRARGETVPDDPPPPPPEKPKGKSMKESSDEVSQTHSKMISLTDDIKQQMITSFSAATDFLSGKNAELEVPKSDKTPPLAALSTAPTEGKYSYPDFINCLRSASRDVNNLIYFQGTNSDVNSAKIEGMLSATLADENGQGPNGMICGTHLGKGAFRVQSWAERAQISQLVLGVTNDPQAESKVKSLLRILAASRQSKSPVSYSDVWKYIWLRTSQLVHFSENSSLPSPQSLAQEFATYEKSDKYYRNERISFKVDWNEGDLKQLISTGEKYGNEVLP